MARTRDYFEALRKELKDPAEAAAYLEAAYRYEDEATFLLALRNVAEAHGFSNVAGVAGLGRESLYKTLSKAGNPKLRTLKSVLEAVGVRMAFQPNKVLPRKPRGSARRSASRRERVVRRA